ncbi:hypothetical protein GC197_13795 [bacterium]|nr:hypothetical protein [bacterium]
MDGPFLTAWTIRLALLVLAASLLLRMIRPWWAVSDGVRRGIWTLGCGLFLAHIVAGMQFYHHWDHGHAYAETARQTYETLGVHFGGGIYVNHLMAIVWTVDVLWWWLFPRSYQTRSSRWEQWIVGFFLFIAFNGLVVFKEGPLRIAGLIGFTLLGLSWLAVCLAPHPKQPLVKSTES